MTKLGVWRDRQRGAPRVRCAVWAVCDYAVYTFSSHDTNDPSGHRATHRTRCKPTGANLELRSVVPSKARLAHYHYTSLVTRTGRIGLMYSIEADCM